MSETDLLRLMENPQVAPWRRRLAQWVESRAIQHTIVAVILLNAVVLGLETSPFLMERFGTLLVLLDKACLAIFIVIATFTILNLFIGIIVSTMQELASLPDPSIPDADLRRTLRRMEDDLATLRAHLDRRSAPDAEESESG